ncbi:hypothetical protein [Streptomyces sp. NPDC053079]|uniref:hypothetical protein n=1 Tax=Streptomyces sp. NPDC053079 TaxID=3365697 RepID=UPI0037D3EC06
MRKYARGTARWTVLALVSLAALTVAPAAQAEEKVITNGFEGYDIEKWDRLRGGDGLAGFENGAGTARSGRVNGWLSTTRGWAREGTWASFGTNIWGPSMVCTAEIYVKPIRDLQFELRVWNAQGTKLATNAPWLVANGNYQTVQVTWRAEYENNAFVEAILGSDGIPRAVRLDDLVVRCNS